MEERLRRLESTVTVLEQRRPLENLVAEIQKAKREAVACSALSSVELSTDLEFLRGQVRGLEGKVKGLEGKVKGLESELVAKEEEFCNWVATRHAALQRKLRSKDDLIHALEAQLAASHQNTIHQLRVTIDEIEG